MRKNQRLFPAALIAAALVVSLPAVAAESDAHCDKMHADGRMGYRHSHMQHAFQHRLETLGLSDGQQEQIRQILERQRPERTAKMQAMRASFKELHEAARSEAYDSGKIQAIADQQARLRADLTVMRADTMHQIYSLLTPEQRQKWDARPRHAMQPIEKG